MLQNNLDPDVAENPQDLVVYGGIGRAARDWACYDQILASLRELNDDEIAAGPVGQAGRRVQDPRRRAARADRQFQPGAQVGQLGALQRARPQGPVHVRPDDGRQLDLHRQPGHRAGHLRDLRRGRPPALRRRHGRALDPDRRPGRHGRRAAAGRHLRWRGLAEHRMPAEQHRLPPAHPLPRQAGARPRRRAGAASPNTRPRTKAVSIGLLGNAGRHPARTGQARAGRRHQAGPGDRPDLGARPDQRLPAQRAGAWRSGRPRSRTRRSTRS